MASPEGHIRQIVGAHVSELIVQLAVARARVDELEAKLRDAGLPSGLEPVTSVNDA